VLGTKKLPRSNKETELQTTPTTMNAVRQT
jgi:hypothetical protein